MRKTAWEVVSNDEKVAAPIIVVIMLDRSADDRAGRGEASREVDGD